MNISKFTQKSTESLNMCEKLAMSYGNQEIEEEHLLLSLIDIEDSLILKLIERMGINTEHFRNRLTEEIERSRRFRGDSPLSANT